MAEIQTSSSGNKRRKITTPRVDLTPMVDLGFLLITFFMYTTTLAKPKAMELQMPRPPEVPAEQKTIPAEATLVVLPTDGHRIAWYSGTQSPSENLHWCSFEGENSLRNLLEKEQHRVRVLPTSFSREAHKLHVLIKTDTSAAYQDMVHTMDEMVIADVPYSSMMRISADEQTAIKKFIPAPYGK